MASVLKFLWRLSPLFNLGNRFLSLALHDLNEIQERDSSKKVRSAQTLPFEMIYLV